MDKYGEFILFKPTYSLKNIFLWLAPIIFLLLGSILFFRSYNPIRSSTDDIDLTISEKKKLRSILNDDKKI